MKSSLKATAFTCAALSFFFITGCSGVMDGERNMAGGTLTAEQRFTLKDLQGDSVSLDQLLTQKKAVLLDFWATWCGYCVEEMPDLVRLQQRYQAQGFTILGVNAGESRELVARFVEKMHVNFPVVLDEETSVSQAFGIVGIPTSVLVGPGGKVLGEYHSFTPKLESDVRSAVERTANA